MRFEPEERGVVRRAELELKLSLRVDDSLGAVIGNGVKLIRLVEFWMPMVSLNWPPASLTSKGAPVFRACTWPVV